MKDTSKLTFGDIPGADWKDSLTTDTTIDFTFWDRVRILFGCELNVHMKTLCEISPGSTQHWPEMSHVCVLKHRWWPHRHAWKYVGESPSEKKIAPQHPNDDEQGVPST